MALNILVADDSTVMRAMIIRILRLTGLSIGQVYEASNGQEALKTLEESPVDMALVDINMPVMNGIDMIENIRKDQAKAGLPILVISSESNTERLDRIRQMNVGFVHKPFTPEGLRKAFVQFAGAANEQFSGENPLSQIGPDF